MTWQELLDYKSQDENHLIGFYDEEEPDYFIHVYPSVVRPYKVKGKQHEGGPNLFASVPGPYFKKRTWKQLKGFIRKEVKDLNKEVLILGCPAGVLITEIKDDVFCIKDYPYPRKEGENVSPL